MSLVPCEFTGSSLSAPSFASDSRSYSISLHHTCSGRIAHSLNAKIIHGLTPFHPIPVSTDRPFQVKAESPAQHFLVCASRRHTHSTDIIHMRNYPISTRHSKMTRGGKTCGPLIKSGKRAIIRTARCCEGFPVYH
jgi:hypothetical protein